MTQKFHRIASMTVLFVTFTASILLAYFAFTTSVSSLTTTPTTMNFQGRLTNASGAVVSDGLYNMKFALYDAASSGTLKWSETRETTNRVQVTNGLFTTRLGDVSALSPSIFASGSLYFEITMATPGTATCSTASCASWESPMASRSLLSTSAYAYNAETLDGLDSAGFIQNQSGGAQATSNFWISGTGIATTLQAATIDTASGTTTLNVGTTNATAGINLNQSTVLAANKSFTLTGGASRPGGTPAEGTMFFDTVTKQLVVFSNNKWQADSKSAAFIVAASDSTQADKDGAQYVADGETSSGSGIGTLDGDQVQINNALNAAAAAKNGIVFLAPGTYTIDQAIQIPNNVTLAGSGEGTIIQLGNFGATTVNIPIITNVDTSTGTGVTIRDLQLDGRKDRNSSGFQAGIYFEHMGASGRAGGKILNVHVHRMVSSGAEIYNSSGISITNNTLESNSGGIYFSAVSNASVVGNTMWGNFFHGIDVEVASQDNSFSANTIHDNSGNGILVDSSTGNSFAGNVIQYNAGIGIEFGTANDNTVSNNTIHDNTNNGIVLTSSSANTIAGNRIQNNGGATKNDGIWLATSDSNTITGNQITDTATSVTNYAINISDSGSDKNYLADNSFTSTAANAAIFDSGTGTVMANQSRAENGGQLTNRTANSTMAFQIQNATAAALFTVDSTSANIIQIGSTTTDATTVSLVLDSFNSGTDPTGVNGAMYYNTNTSKFRCYQGGAWANCMSNLQDAYNNSTSPATITTTAAKGLSLTAGAAPTADMMTITNVGQGVATGGVSGLEVNYEGGAGAIEASAIRTDLTPGGTSGSTWNGLRIVANATGPVSGVTSNGIKIEGPTSQGAGQETGMYIGTGWDTGLDVQSGGLNLAGYTSGGNPADPPTPTGDNLRVYAKKVSGRMLLKTKGPSGVDNPVQPALFGNNIVMWTPTSGSTVTGGFGTLWATSSGGAAATTPVPSATAPAMSNQMHRYQKLNVVTTANQALGVRANATDAFQFWSGNAAGLGGYFFSTRFVVAAYPGPTIRIFAGLSASATEMVKTDAIQNNTVGLWHDITDNATTLNLATNAAATGTKKAITLSNALAAGNSYDWFMFMKPNDTTVYYRLDDLVNGVTYEGNTATTLPANNAFMAPQVEMSNGTANLTASTVGIGVVRIYIESDH